VNAFQTSVHVFFLTFLLVLACVIVFDKCSERPVFTVLTLILIVELLVVLTTSIPYRM